MTNRLELLKRVVGELCTQYVETLDAETMDRKVVIGRLEGLMLFAKEVMQDAEMVEVIQEAVDCYYEGMTRKVVAIHG